MPTKPLPSSFIASETVNKRTKLYRAGVHATNSPTLKTVHGDHCGETRWIWYSKEQVKEWWDEITDLGASGIRIYLGQKEVPDENEVQEDHEPRAGQICIMLVLTKVNENDPERHDNIIYENLPEFVERKKLTESSNSMSLNAGSYSPPLNYTITDDYPNDLLT